MGLEHELAAAQLAGAVAEHATCRRALEQFGHRVGADAAKGLVPVQGSVSALCMEACDEFIASARTLDEARQAYEQARFEATGG